MSESGIYLVSNTGNAVATVSDPISLNCNGSIESANGWKKVGPLRKFAVSFHSMDSASISASRNI